jgi:hypothetical protein
LQRAQFGRRSERLDPDQLALGLEDLDGDLARQEEKRPRIEKHTERPSHRKPLPDHLPREDVRLDIDDMTCACCGSALHVIGESVSEMLDWIPAQLRVVRTTRPKYACRPCDIVVQAPAPERVIAGGLATPALLAQVSAGFACRSMSQKTAFQHAFGQFLHKQRYAVGAVDDLAHDLLWQRLATCDVLDQGCAALAVQSVERQHRHLRLADLGRLKNSGRNVTINSDDKLRTRSTTRSSSSRELGSIQCTSSNFTTTGCRRARPLSWRFSAPSLFFFALWAEIRQRMAL